MKVETSRLKAFILDAGLVTKEQFDGALAKAKKTRKEPRDILISEGLVSEKDLVKLEAYILGVPFVNLEKMKIPSEILKMVPDRPFGFVYLAYHRCGRRYSPFG